jgi:hypothetical protein
MSAELAWRVENRLRELYRHHYRREPEPVAWGVTKM